MMPCIIFGLLHVFCLISASLFFRKYLYRDYKVDYVWVEYIFSLACVVSFSLMSLLILEVLEPLTTMSHWRAHLWLADLWLMISLVYVIIPVLFLSLFLQPYVANPFLRFVLILVCVPPFWFLFIRSGAALNIYTFQFTSHQLFARMAVFGVSAVSALSGFGAVQFPIENLPIFTRPVSLEEAQGLEEQLLETMKLITDRKVLAAASDYSSSSSVLAGGAASGSSTSSSSSSRARTWRHWLAPPTTATNFAKINAEYK
eukprot:Filipodium_phascolosomae@DN6726_c0_g1_i1.p1